MLKSFDNYIFDLDGTLINSSDEILKCLKLALKEENVLFDEKKFNSDIIGPPIQQIIKQVTKSIDENTLNQIITNFRKFYDFDDKDESCLYENVYNCLRILNNNRKQLFIATFKPLIPTQRLMNNFKLSMFKDTYTIDYPNNFSTKTEMVKFLITNYNLNKNKTVLIGDSLSDIVAGKENNIYTIGALWGYSLDKSNIKKNADLTINNIEDLI